MLDKFRSTDITWDKATSRIYSTITANASDENGRKLVVQIVNGGQVEDLTGATLHLYWETRDKSHDGLDVFKAVDLKNGEFELSYTTGMLSNKGVLNANLVLIDTVGRVVSERFKITVTEGIDNDAIQSENSFTTLTQALIDISNLEQNYAPRLNDLTAQLQQTEQELSSQLAQKADEADLLVEKARIDSFTTLTAGSTTGDAELIDGRVGTDGITYANIGGAIRGQITTLKQFANLSIPNILENGDFLDGIARWSGNANTLLTFSNGVLTGESIVNGSFAIVQPVNRTVVIGRKYFIFVRAKSNVTKACGFRLGTGQGFPTFTFTPSAEFQDFAAIVTATADVTNTLNIYMSSAVVGDKLELDKVVFMDLTTGFNGGVEPALDVFNWLYSKIGYPMTVSLSQKQTLDILLDLHENGTGAKSEDLQLLQDQIDALTQEEVTPADIITAAEKVLALQNEHTLTFAFVTDTHLLESNRVAIKALNYLSKRCGIDFIAHGGDIIDGMIPKAQELENLSKIREYVSELDVPFIFCKGNHDDNNFYPRQIEGSNSLNMYITNFELYNRTVRFEEDGVVVGNREKFYYYRDHEGSKIRTIFINPQDVPFEANPDGTAKYNLFEDSGYSNEQLNWLGSTALDLTTKDVPSDWSVILIGHRAGDSTVTTNDLLYDILTAYQNGTTYTTTAETVYGQYNISVDFTTQGAMEVLSFFHGDYHTDGYLRYRPFRLISTRDSITSPAIDIFTIDRSIKTVYATRYGAGLDRVLPYD